MRVIKIMHKINSGVGGFKFDSQIAGNDFFNLKYIFIDWKALLDLEGVVHEVVTD